MSQMQVANITFSAAGSTRIETDSTANTIKVTVNSANVMYANPSRTVFPTGTINVDNELAVTGRVRAAGEANVAGNMAIAGSLFIAGANVVALIEAAGGGDPAASQAEQEAATEAAKYVAPATQHFHPSAAKFWLRATQSSTTLEASYNITSVGDTSAGVMTVTIANDMSSADYAVLVTVDDGSTTLVKSSVARSLAAGTFIMGSVVEAGSSADPTVAWMAVGFGDL